MNRRRMRSRLIAPNFIAKSIVLAMISLTLAIMPETFVGSSAASQTGVAFDFFRIVEKPTNDRSDHLQSVKINERGRSFVIYTERNPSYRIPLSEIISITIERERTRGWKVEGQERETGKGRSQFKKEQDMVEQEGGYVYKATFSISKSEKKRLDEFAHANGQQRFDFRFGDSRLGRVQFVGRFAGVSETKNEFATFLEATNVQERFGPLNEKVIWK
jgi:hypothetical protein